jgi:hypothetical protein
MEITMGNQHPITEELLTEICEQFVECGHNPSELLLDALGKATGMTKEIVRRHYTSVYQTTTRSTKDPFDFSGVGVFPV